jgi:hypothetical protein
MFRYKLCTPLGEEIGEATYRFLVEPGEELTVGDNQHLRVVDVIPLEEQGSDVVALLYVEAA